MSAKDMEPTYTSDDFSILEGLDAVRKRPGMYVAAGGEGGARGTAGLSHLTLEVWDNSVDEAVAGYCDTIIVTLFADGAVRVEDNGRGIPFDYSEKLKMSAVEVAFTTLHAGSKFGGGGYKTASSGLHGVGASICNALSKRLDVVVRRDGEVNAISFSRGPAGVFAGDDGDAPFTPKKGLRKMGKMKKGERSGTTVTFWPDPTIFHPGSITDPATIEKRMRTTAFLVPGLKAVLRDETGDEVREEVFQYTGGTQDMVEFLATDKDIAPIIHMSGTGVFTETIPIIDETTGQLVNGDVEREVLVDIALRWGNGYEKDINSFVNTVATPHHGTHVKGFERALLSTIRKGYEGTRLLKANEAPPILEDVTEGLTAVVSVAVPEPQFIGQAKEELGTSEVTKVVQDLVNTQLQRWLDKNKPAARTILEKAANASRARLAARTQREAARRKTALEGASMPAKLVDCRAVGVERSELFLVEGDSALGSARSGRNSEYQALLPLRGKILNVQKASTADMLKNAECAAILQVIGAGSGKTFDLDQMRYGKILIFADADVDGSHIRCLLVALFHRYMRPIIEDGRLFAAMPPLHKIEVLGRNKETVYTYTQYEMETTVAKLEKAGKKIKRPIQRYKGLGEMNADELWETTMDPSVRSVRRITIDDAEAAEKSLDLLMGTNVEARRNWLIENSDRVELEELS